MAADTMLQWLRYIDSLHARRLWKVAIQGCVNSTQQHWSNQMSASSLTQVLEIYSYLSFT